MLLTDARRLMNQALDLRSELLMQADTTAWRLLNGQADGIEGLVIERLADILIVQLHEGRLSLAERDVRRLAEELRERLGARAVYRKWFVRDRARLSEAAASEHVRREPWIGEPVEPELIVRENALRFVVRPYDGYSVGLFLEHRNTRGRIRSLSAGRRVLNTFAYTCGFTVAAAAGGAAATASVDLHKRYLEWGKQNLAANGIETPDHLFFASEVFDFYGRARRQHRRYDLVILDPPTFSRTRRPERVFVLEQQLEPLVSGALGLLESGGIIVLSTNHRGIGRERLESALTSAAGERACQILERPHLPADFAGDPGYSKTVLAAYG